MNILLTGGTGFIGNAFLRLALAQGHSVAGLVLPGLPLPADLAGHDRLRWLTGSLAEAPWDAVAAFQPDVCVHSAWIAIPGVYLESPDNELFRQWSVTFMRRLREQGLNRFVVLGTCIEYQPASRPFVENQSPLEARNAYTRAKNALREQMEQEFAGSSTRLAWARVFYPYGVGEHPARVGTSFIQKLVRNEPLTLATPESVKDFIYIDDLVSGLLRVVESGYAGPINLGTGQGVTIGQVARLIAELLGKSDLVQERTGVVDPYPHVVADSSRLRALGWQPQVDLREGHRRLIASVLGKP